MGWQAGNTANLKALEIARLYAAINYIGQGIGALLMQHCIAYAKSNAASSIWLGVWQQNTKAIRFYTKLVLGWRAAIVFC